MTKIKTHYVCQNCGRTSPRALGRCPQCEAWGTMVEEPLPAENQSRKSPRFAGTAAARPRRMDEIEGDAEARLPVPVEEFSRVLGGGIVPGSVVLIGGDPGIGKSTLLLQIAMHMAASLSDPVLYVSGEESERQIKMRAMRLLGQSDEKLSLLRNLLLVTETNLDAVFDHIRELQPGLLIVDSIQTMYLPDMESTAGSVSQVRESASRLRELAKSSGMAVFLIGHVTKEGAIAGPRVLEHIVDTVLYLEGERYQTFRLLRSVKNRFGATSEVGVFEMREKGLVEVSNPSEAFLAERLATAAGSAIAVTMEGTRPLLVELQGLTTHSSLANPRRTANGVDFNRLLLITAVLTRRLGLRLADQDVFLNVVGGLRVEEPAADLAIAAAIASSARDLPVKADVALIGEIGLSGELRWVGQMDARLKEAAKLGFKSAVVPRRLRQRDKWPADITVHEVRSLREALSLALLQPAVKDEAS